MLHPMSVQPVQVHPTMGVGVMVGVGVFVGVFVGVLVGVGVNVGQLTHQQSGFAIQLI